MSIKLLALCDSPTLTTGFARVAQNLFKCWARRGVHIDCFGIGFSGWDYRKCPYVHTLMPAGDGGNWQTPERLNIFLAQLMKGGYTHVWIMQDPWQLINHNFPETLRRVCADKNVRSMFYFPVDGPMDPAWTDILAAVDIPMAYTAFGAEEAMAKARERKQYLAAAKMATTFNYDFECHHLPHGVDTHIYRPWPNRKEFRHRFYGDVKWLKDDDFVIINVNTNQCRKDTPRSLEIHAGLLARGIPARLVMHMPAAGSPDQQINLDDCAVQLGLKMGEWCHHTAMFRGTISVIPEETDLSVKGNASLVGLYNMADLYLTTTLGEGWGLGITEALACGTPVAMPGHTSCKEIGERLLADGYGDMRVMLPLEEGTIVHRLDNSRMRPRADLRGSIDAIEKYYLSGMWKQRKIIADNETLKRWLSWEFIAANMLTLLNRETAVKTPAPAESAVKPSPEPTFVSFAPMEVCQ